jgi:hypothetical protein
MRLRMRDLQVLLPIGILLLVVLLFESDKGVFAAFLSLVGICSMLAGRELAHAFPPKAGVIVSVIVLVGIAVLYACGIARREPGYSEYLVYLGVLMVGEFVPLSLILEVWRGRRRRVD